jgi:trigger factor
MNISVVQSAPCRKNVKVEIASEAVEREFDSIQGFFSKKANLPGFRPGHAPVALVARKFAREIGEEVAERLVAQAYRGMVEEEKIAPVSIVDVKHEPPLRAAPFSVDFTVDVAPVFDPPDWKQIRIEPRKIEVTEAQLEERLNELRLSRGTLSEIENESAAMGDFVQLDYAGETGGTPLAGRVDAEHQMSAAAVDFWVLLGTSTCPVPGLLESVVGLKKGEIRKVEVIFPADFAVKDLAGIAAQYDVTVKAVRRRQPAEVNEEFLKALQVGSVEELKERIRGSQLRAVTVEEAGRQREEAVQWLLKNTVLTDLPDSMVEQETRRILRRMVFENLRNGVPQAELESHQQDLYQSASRGSQDRVKLDYILHRIADDSGIQVSADEVAQEYEILAQRMETTVAKVRQRIEKEHLEESMQDDLRSQKTLQMILTHAMGDEAPRKEPAQ